MTTPQKNTSCQLGCWALALGIALVIVIGISIFGKMTITGAIFLGIVAFIVSGVMLGWLLCRPLPSLGGTVEDAGEKETKELSVKAASEQAAETKSALADSGLKPSTPLSGEAELASRKGTWRYSGSGSAVGTEPAKAARKKVAKSAASEDGIVKAPKKLEGPRGGVADDLKQIKGIGPKLEKLCHSLGFFHFDQIANWTDDEVAWVDANLEGFKGRVTSNRWVAQAKELLKR